MKKKIFCAFLVILTSLTIFAGCRKENPTVDIKVESTVNSISYDLDFKDIKSNKDRKYKIVLSNKASVIVEDINLLTEDKGEFKNLQFNTEYTITVYVGKKAKSTDYNIEIGKENILTKLNEFKDISFEGKNVTYNGEEHSIYVTGAPDGTNIEYIDTNGKTYVDKYVQTDVGTYEVTAKLTKDGYKETILKANLVISKKNHVFNFNDFSKEYDGQPIDVSLKTNLDVKYEYYSGNTKLDKAPVNVGVYTVKAIFAGDKNNSAFELTAKYIILEADVKLVLNNKTVYYTGLPQTIEVENNIDVTYEYYSGNTKLDGAPVDAGKYIVKAIYAGDDNHEAKTAEAILTIEKAKTVISVSKKEITVDYGKAYSINASVSNGATPTITYNTTDGKVPVNVGEYIATISYAGDDNHEKAEDLLVKIIIQSADVELKLDNKTVTYDGNAHEVSIDTPLDIVYEYYLGETKLSSAPVNAGVYTVKAIYAGDENHEAKTVEATLTIQKATPKLDVRNLEVTYDGNEHPVVAELSNGATPTITYNTTDGKAPINAGEYTAVVSYAGDENHNCINDVTVNIVIKKVVLTLTTSDDIEVIYDGNPHGITALLSNGSVPTIVYNTADGKAPCEIGEYTATVSFEGNINFEPVETKVVNIVITKAKYDMSNVKFEDLTVTYTGEEYELVINGELPEGVTVSYKDNKATNVGTYTAVAEFTYDEVNYEAIQNKTATLIIEKAVVSINAEDISVKYEEEYEVTYVCDYLCRIEYYKDNVLLAEKPTEMGGYTAKIVFDETENYKGSSKTISITINNPDYQNLEIYLDDMEFTWGDSIFINPTTNNELITRLDLSIIITNENNEVVEEDLKPGNYIVTVKFVKNDELFINEAVKTSKLVVLKQSTTITPDNESLSSVYSPDLVIEAFAKVSNGAEAKFAFFDSNNNKLDKAPSTVGKYKVVYSYDGDEYYAKADDVEIDFEIFKSDSYIIVETTVFSMNYFDDANIEEILNAAYLVANPSVLNTKIDAKVKLAYGTLDGSVPNSPGEYKAYLSFDGNDCYNAAETIEIEIYYTSIENEVITSEGINVYVDEEYTIEYETTYDREVTIKYYTLYGVEVEKPTKAGQYYAVLSTEANENFKGTSITVNVIINKYDSVIETEKLEIVVDYTGEPVVVTATVTGDNIPTIIYGNYDGIDVINNTIVNAGRYFAQISFAGNEKYNAADTVNVDITINKIEIEDTTVVPESIRVRYYEGIIVQGIYSDLVAYSLYAVDETQELKLGNNNVNVKYHFDDNHIDYEYTLKVTVNKYIRGWGIEQVGRQITGREFDPSIIKIGVTYEHDEFEYLDTSKYEIKLAEGYTTFDAHIKVIVTVSSFGSNVYDNEQGFTLEYEFPSIEAPELMIYAVYGAGGNKDASYKNDFVILYNANNTAYNLQDFVLWQYSSNGTTPTGKYALSGFIEAYGFYVIQCGGGNYDVPKLPFDVDDDKCTLNFAESNFKVVLTVSPKEVDLSDYTNSNYVDILGVGSATIYEGTGAAPAIDKTSFIKRKNFIDTNDNANDFEKVLFVNETFIFLNEGYSTYIELDQTLTDLNIGSDKIEEETEFYVPSALQNRKITWTAYENGEISQLVTINENGCVTAKPVTGEVHSVLLVGSIENSDFTVTRSLNLSNLQSLGNLVVTLTDFKVTWNALEKATSYEVYVANSWLKTLSPEDALEFDLSGVTTSLNVYVIAKAPTGYVDATSNSVYFDHGEAMGKIFDLALEEATKAFKESYTLLEEKETIPVLPTVQSGLFPVTLTYSSTDSIVSIIENVIIITKPNEETNITILVTASIEGQTVTDKIEVPITVIAAEANYLLTKVTNINQLYNGVQIILTYKNESASVTMGAYNTSKYFDKYDFEVEDKMYIDEASGITIITLEKVIVDGIGYWYLKLNEENYIYYTGSKNELYVGAECDAKAQWNISVDNGIISIANVSYPSRLIKYNSSTPRFSAYTSTMQLISAYIFEDINETVVNESLVEVSKQIKDSYSSKSNSISISLPLVSSLHNDIKFIYSASNASYSDNNLIVEKEENNEVLVQLTVKAMNGDQVIKSITIPFVVIFVEDISERVEVDYKQNHTLGDIPVIPEVEVSLNEKTLVLGKDYTVEYKNNEAVTEKAEIIITFIGKYKGTVTKYFIIEGQSGGDDTPVEPSEPVTISVIIKDYAETHSWQNGVKYSSLDMDENVSISVSGQANAGKYYTSGNEWRMYQSAKSAITITASSEYIIKTVKITYKSSSNGYFTCNNQKIVSNEIVTINSNTIEFVATSEGTSGQANISAIEVVYEKI